MVIMSKRETGKGDGFYSSLILDIFDSYTYYFLGATLAILIIYVRLAERVSWSRALIVVAGASLGKQNAPHRSASTGTVLKPLLSLVSFTSFIFYTSLSGSIVARLLVEHKPMNIETLNDLEQQPNLKVFFQVYTQLIFRLVLLGLNEDNRQGRQCPTADC